MAKRNSLVAFRTTLYARNKAFGYALTKHNRHYGYQDCESCPLTLKSFKVDTELPHFN